MHVGLVGLFFDGGGTSGEIAVQEGPGGISLLGDVADVGLPVQLALDGHP